jgi:outer membrane lipoprotein SlyB
MEPTRAKGGRRQVCAGLAAALWGVAAAAYGQPIRIPDLREPPRATLKPGEACERCGTIRSIREVRLSRPVPVPRAFQNEPMDQGLGSTVIVGAVVALPLGGDPDKNKPFVGGVGTPEMRERFTESTYEVTIRLDDGGYTMVQRADGASFRVGDRVRVQGTQLEQLAN